MNTTPPFVTPFKICVAGPGAIGTTLAALLSAGGERVTIVARGDSLSSIASAGVSLEQRNGEIRANVVTSDGSDLVVHDVLLLCSKAQDLEALAISSNKAIGPETMIVPVVNGIPWWYFQGVEGRFRARSVTSVDPAGVLATILSPGCQSAPNIHPFYLSNFDPPVCDQRLACPALAGVAEGRPSAGYGYLRL
ncbi:ketopantoate reductase family protein [Agrobacterium tumefaciens]|uniref:ketopantoate reductase family protein n=1 Tax=Agrobacterium tumefaciens TaxID=358 RepID=UPI000A9AE01A